MKRENNRFLLNTDELNQVTGGVTYEYEHYRVVFPGDEEDPHDSRVRLIIGALIAISKRGGESLEDLLSNKLLFDEDRDDIRYYWDKVILN